jgi:putative copper resistance protein D
MGAATLIGARFLQFSAALVLFGSPLFYLYGFESGAPPAAAPARWPWQRSVLLIAAATALFGAFAWVMAETASFSGDTSEAVSPAALWTVLSATRFGQACLVRIGLLILSLVASLSIHRMKMLWIVQGLLGAAVTASFAWTGHGAVDRGLGGVVHLGGDLLHLLAAGIWIGALLPLAVLVLRSIRSQTPDDARATQFGLDRFSAIGIWVVSAIVLSGIINSWFLIGPSRWRALFATGYGVALLIKLGLFGMMLALAGLNRYRTAPALRATLHTQRSTQPALRALRSTVLSETALALLVLLAVSVLGTLAPPISGQ